MLMCAATRFKSRQNVSIWRVSTLGTSHVTLTAGSVYEGLGGVGEKRGRVAVYRRRFVPPPRSIRSSVLCACAPSFCGHASSHSGVSSRYAAMNAATWQEMKDDGISPNVINYNLAVRALGRGGGLGASDGPPERHEEGGRGSGRQDVQRRHRGKTV